MFVSIATTLGAYKKIRLYSGPNHNMVAVFFGIYPPIYLFMILFPYKKKHVLHLL